MIGFKTIAWQQQVGNPLCVDLGAGTPATAAAAAAALAVAAALRTIIPAPACDDIASKPVFSSTSHSEVRPACV